MKSRYIQSPKLPAYAPWKCCSAYFLRHASTRAAPRPAMMPASGAGDFCVGCVVGLAVGFRVGVRIGSAVGVAVGAISPGWRITVDPVCLPPDDGMYGVDSLVSNDIPIGENLVV